MATEEKKSTGQPSRLSHTLDCYSIALKSEGCPLKCFFTLLGVYIYLSKLLSRKLGFNNVFKLKYSVRK